MSATSLLNKNVTKNIYKSRTVLACIYLQIRLLFRSSSSSNSSSERYEHTYDKNALLFYPAKIASPMRKLFFVNKAKTSYDLSPLSKAHFSKCSLTCQFVLLVISIHAAARRQEGVRVNHRRCARPVK